MLSERAKAVAAAADLRSPADGVVVARKVQQGEPVNPSMTDLFQIATQLTSLQAVITPDARTLARIHAGQTAAVRLPGPCNGCNGPTARPRNSVGFFYPPPAFV